MTPTDKVVIAGAGSIGCFVGGVLARGGREVFLLARGRIADEVRSHRLHLTDLAGLDARVSADAIGVSTDSAALNDAAVVLVTVKSGATEDWPGASVSFTPLLTVSGHSAIGQNAHISDVRSGAASFSLARCISR